MLQRSNPLIASIRHGRSERGWLVHILAVVMLVVLAACSSTGNESSSTTGATTQFVAPTSSEGSPGKGPQVITSPTPLPGGGPGSQQIVLADRTLVIVSVTRQPAPGAGAALISLVLTVRNTSAKAIMNLPGYFQLSSSGGDAFGYQYNSSDNFYSPIAGHTSRDGLIVFEVPAAALKSGLRLHYHPEVATEVVITSLKVS
jgi:hypothetical protein